MAIRSVSCSIYCLLLATGLACAQPIPPQIALARQGDWQALDVLLEDGLSPNVVYGDGSTALHWASYHDNAAAAQALLDAGAEVNAANDLGATPLWLAATNGSVEMTGLLLTASADPGMSLLSGETVVMTASQAGNAEVVRLLLEAGGDVDAAVTRGQTALMWAANRGHSEVVAALLDHGADVAARTDVSRQYVKSEKEQDSHPAYKYWVEEGGNTPLIFAARAGDRRSVQLLVEAGADVNAESAFGTSPLIMAVHGGNAEVVRYLLQEGAAPDASSSGHTALHDAVLRGNLHAVAALLEHGADIEARLERPTPVRRQTSDYNFHNALIGASPLWLAARFTEPEIMSLLLQHGADAQVLNRVTYPAQRMAENFISDEGDISVLMAAVGMGHRRLRMSWGTPERRAGQTGVSGEELILSAVRVAVAAGVDLDQTNAEGETALDFARARRLTSVADYLSSL